MTYLVQSINAMILDMFRIPIYEILVRTPLINHPPTQLLRILVTILIYWNQDISIMTLLPLQKIVVHFIPPIGLFQSIFHDLFFELCLEIGKFENEAVVIGSCDSISFIGFFDASFGRFDSIFGNLNFMLGCCDECFDFLDGEVKGIMLKRLTIF